MESNQSHIIKISDCENGAAVREKIKLKFNMKPEVKFHVCILFKEKSKLMFLT